MNLQEFKERLKRFNEALIYIQKKQKELKADPARYAKIKLNFKNKFEKPLDEAWDQLSVSDKNKVPLAYLESKVIKDEKVKEVIDFFNGEIIEVTH